MLNIIVYYDFNVNVNGRSDKWLIQYQLQFIFTYIPYEFSGQPTLMRRLARAFAAHIHKVWL